MLRHLATIRKMLNVHSNVALMRVVSGQDLPVKSSVNLTPRGAEVFALILEDVSNTEIATRLGISYSTVRRHREKMLLCNACGTMKELIAKHYGKFDAEGEC